MAEILITGMEMPTDEDEALVLVLYENGRVRKALDYNIIALSKETTTAKELTTPHGRLGDMDALVSNIKNVYCNGCKRSKVMCNACKYGDILDEIDDAPTVLEASRERE